MLQSKKMQPNKHGSDLVRPLGYVRGLFTLLEMIIALSILSVIGIVTTVQIKKLVNTYRFEAEVTDFFIALQEAQVLSAAYQTDIALDIFLVDGKPAYRFSTAEPFPESALSQKRHPLAHVAQCKCSGKKRYPYHFDLYSGRVEPRGMLSFSQTQESEKALWFDLQYGHLLKFSYTKPPLVKLQIPAPPKKEEEKSVET